MQPPHESIEMNDAHARAPYALAAHVEEPMVKVSTDITADLAAENFCRQPRINLSTVQGGTMPAS
jgi:hypothetical protein